MKYTFEYFNSRLRYEPETGLLFWRTGRRIGRVAGCIGVEGYVQMKSDGRQFKAHRIAWLLATGSWPKDQLDHINHNCSDNRLINLREVNNEQNGYNRALQKNNKSKITGVSFFKPTNQWRVDIRIRKKLTCLGFFDDILEARKVRIAAEKKYYGNFAPARVI